MKNANTFQSIRIDKHTVCNLPYNGQLPLSNIFVLKVGTNGQSNKSNKEMGLPVCRKYLKAETRMTSNKFNLGLFIVHFSVSCVTIFQTLIFCIFV